ncbi:hypothetical protein [Candidatus Uabimicrobium sp. HlEnr_7]|uniref:hypothetical protein n=1 Tax=Candidatus Uabimicrobium helgolandensis TaxID=3095367 RepID=UPI003557705B
MNITIAFPVDENIDSYIVKINYIKGNGKDTAFCLGENNKSYASDLPKNSGAYKLWQRISEQYKDRYSFQFDPVRSGKSLNADITLDEAPLRPEDISDFVTWRGTSDSLAWAMAIAAAFSSYKKQETNPLLIAFSADIDFEPQNLELFYPIIKPLCQDGSIKAIDSLQRKWQATRDNNGKVLVLHEKDAILLKKSLNDKEIRFVQLEKNTFKQIEQQNVPHIVSCKPSDIKVLCESLNITKGFFVEQEKLIITKKRFKKLHYTRLAFLTLLYTAVICFLMFVILPLFETLPELPKKTDKQRFFLFEITKISNYRDELWREEFKRDAQIINEFLGNDPDKAQEIARNLVRYKELDFNKKVSPFPTPGISLKIPKLEPRLIQILLGNESNNGWAFMKYCQSGQSPIPIIFRERKTASKDVPLPSELQMKLDTLDALARGNVIGNTEEDYRFYFLIIITKTIEGCSVKVRFFKSLEEVSEHTNTEDAKDEIFVPKMIEDLEFDIHTNCIKFRKIKQWKTLNKVRSAKLK